jgi:hypothetical protein
MLVNKAAEASDAKDARKKCTVVWLQSAQRRRVVCRFVGTARRKPEDDPCLRGGGSERAGGAGGVGPAQFGQLVPRPVNWLFRLVGCYLLAQGSKT